MKKQHPTTLLMTVTVCVLVSVNNLLLTVAQADLFISEFPAILTDLPRKIPIIDPYKGKNVAWVGG